MHKPKPKTTPDDSPANRQFTASEVREFMDRHGINSSEFARRFCVSTQTVTYWRSGERVPSPMATKFMRLIDKFPNLLREL